MRIEDFTSRHDISNYLNKNNLKGFGLEVGVLRGEFSKSILNKWGGEKLYLVDSWVSRDDIIDINNGDKTTQLINFSETFKNIYEYKNRAVIIREDSFQASKLFNDEFFDFIYIDAGHDYDSVSKDLITWFPKLKVGGLFCGDDYLDGVMLGGGATIFEVKSAVDEFALKNNLLVETFSSTTDEFPQWYITKR